MKAALNSLDFLVVQEIIVSDTANVGSPCPVSRAGCRVRFVDPVRTARAKVSHCGKLSHGKQGLPMFL